MAKGRFVLSSTPTAPDGRISIGSRVVVTGGDLEGEVATVTCVFKDSVTLWRDNGYAFVAPLDTIEPYAEVG